MGRRSIGQKIPICFVDHQGNLFAVGQIKKCLHQFRTVNCSCRIVRTDQQNGPCAWPDQCFRLLRIRQKPCRSSMTGKRHDPDSLHRAPHFVIKVTGLRNNDFIAGPRQSHYSHAESMVSARTDRHIFWTNLPLIIPRQRFSEQFPQRFDTQNWCIKCGLNFLCRNRHGIPQTLRRGIAWHGLRQIQKRTPRRDSGFRQPGHGLWDGGLRCC